MCTVYSGNTACLLLYSKQNTKSTKQKSRLNEKEKGTLKAIGREGERGREKHIQMWYTEIFGMRR